MLVSLRKHRVGEKVLVHARYTVVELCDMPLKLYRRHLRSCGFKDRDFIGCQCPLWLVGKTDSGIVPRQSTGTCDLREAERLKASLLAEGKSPEVYGPKVRECAAKYLESRQHEMAKTTQAQHKLLLHRLVEFCEARGVFFMSELTVDLLEEFKLSGLVKLADTTKGNQTAKLRCFLRDALRRGWIKESLADRVRPHRSTHTHQQKEPYTEEEVKRILTGAFTLGHGRDGFAGQPRTFRLLVELMLATGLRVGDAIMYDPTATFYSSQMWVYQFHPQKSRRDKAPRLVKVYLTDALKKAIDECARLSPRYPFLPANATRVYAANDVYKRMKIMGRQCGVEDCRPHRLRDTFAVRLLLRGVPLEEVSRLLGHSSVTITERYYAKWIRAREDRLEGLLAKALMDTGSN